MQRVWPAIVIILAVCFCSGTLAYASADPHGDPADWDEFIQLEQVWNEAHLKGDAATLQRLWSDDLQIVVPKMSPMTKSDALGFVRSGRMKFEHYDTSHLNVRRYGDTVVVTGQMKRSRRMNQGQSVDDNWQFTKVYSHTAGYWRVVMFQASELPMA